MSNTGLLIDWLTLRIPLNKSLGEDLCERVQGCINHIYCVDSSGERVWEKGVLDVDALRSDSVGLFWIIQSDGLEQYLTIGASPASLEYGVNAFG